MAIFSIVFIGGDVVEADLERNISQSPTAHQERQRKQTSYGNIISHIGPLATYPALKHKFGSGRFILATVWSALAD
jgi:hypothetical protein